MLTKTALVTVPVNDACADPVLAITVYEPGATADSSPIALIVAILLGDTLQAASLVTFKVVPFEKVAMAVSWLE
jgi:hypothetical protein